MILENKTAVITGSGRGIGRAVAIEFAKEGADVAVVGARRVESAREVADTIRKLGRRAIAVMADVTDKGQVKNLFDVTLKEFGKVDILVNNAGTLAMGRFTRTTEEQWHEMINVHLMGTVNCISAVAEHMMERNSGRIINVVSPAALMGGPRVSAYSAAKGAVVSLTRVLAREFAPYRITVNAISPQADTEMLDQMKERPKWWEESMKFLLFGLPEPEDIAPSFAFLASDKAKYITGQILNVDSGFIIG